MLTSVNKNYLKLTPCPKTWSSFSISQNWNEKHTPALSTVPPSPSMPLSPAVAEEGAPHWVGDSVWRMIEVPACAEHFKYLQRYFKKRSWHVLLLLPPCPSTYPTPPALPPFPARGLQFRRHSLFVECFAHFLVERPKGKFNFKCGMRAALLRAIRAKSVGEVRCGGRCGALWMGCGTWARVSF